MSELYYWNTTLPAFKTTSANPKDYFKTLIYKDDRFSAIFESYTDILNELNGVSSADIGFNFQLFRESSTNNNVLGMVEYVKPGTPAQSLGIKRGDMFRKINGTQMTMSNYSTVINYLLDSSTSSSITFSTYLNKTFIDKTALNVNKAINYQEDPVYMDTVYTVQNKKVGYLVYNFFSNDKGDSTMKYDQELNTAIGNFKSQNISELIVDLRYNHGGMISSAINLASMLVPDLAANKVFVLTEYNQNYTDYFNSALYDSQKNGDPFTDDFALNIYAKSPPKATYPVQNIGNNLQRIFFLTGRNTASASEMVINGLKPFITCVLIGDTTVGKNVGSTLLHDTNNSQNQWAILPIILKYFNKDHFSDFTAGFAPNFLVTDDYSHLLGDPSESLLATAISQISGQGVSAAKTIQVKRVPLKSSIDFKRIQNGLIIDNKKFLKQH
jgi:C-terminal processing protease CtpA/Prc